MAEYSDFEKKGAALDGTLADDRSTAEGQVYRPEVHADLTSERKYGKFECSMHEYSKQNEQWYLRSSPVRKLDLWLLPFLSIMYFFNSIDRVSHANTTKRN